MMYGVNMSNTYRNWEAKEPTIFCDAEVRDTISPSILGMGAFWGVSGGFCKSLGMTEVYRES